MYDPHNTLLLFEGNRIGLFLSKSELEVLPALMMHWNIINLLVIVLMLLNQKIMHLFLL